MRAAASLPSNTLIHEGLDEVVVSAEIKEHDIIRIVTRPVDARRVGRPLFDTGPPNGPAPFAERDRSAIAPVMQGVTLVKP
ncbi:hypothetical protein CSQ85_11840 [Bifidobacterium rousetti]|nr:hypothetical protein CSQ85_11840 [Bifidobacterium rousetti]